jgi:FKBP-type peptidyl-prolyl cis-trans isomerase FklB
MTFKAYLASVMLVATTSAFAAEPAVSLQSDTDRVSYSIGTDIGTSLKKMGAEIDVDKLAAGLRDALTGSKLQLTPEEIATTMQTFQTKAREKVMAQRQEAASKAVKEGADFLEANKKKDGVVTLPSGLQYKVIKQGDGVKPTASDTVKTHYRGTLVDGTEFDSSYKRNEPATFPVNGVIKGWTEALRLMPVGSKWQLVIPANLAYGEQGAGADIPPNSVLVFDIELLEIAKAAK